MVTTLNKRQQIALKEVFDRGPIYRKGVDERAMTYREFRRTIQFVHVLQCVLVHWRGMWLGIEKDGYTHS